MGVNLSGRCDGFPLAIVALRRAIAIGAKP